jgi:subtilase family serine protease
VLTITGLDTTKSVMKTDSTAETVPAGYRNAPVCSSYYGQKTVTTGPDGTKIPKYDGKQVPSIVCGYVGTQLRSAYEGTTSLTGKGVTIGILGAYASPTIAKDASIYAAKHGDGSYSPGQLTQTNPSFTVDEDECGDPTDYYGEETLDIEASHAMASKANLHYYGVTSCEDTDFEDTYTKILDQNSVQIVSTSYGDAGEDVGPAELIVEPALFARGALQGISFVNSSGDDGDEVADIGTAEPDFPASSPFVTAVGATADAIGANGRFIGQTGWGTDEYSLDASGTTWDAEGFVYGSGGGVSQYFAKPAYQQGVASGTQRVVPDVAMDGDVTTGFLVGETQEFSNGTYYDEARYGGTSVSSPLFAGMTALALQKSGHRAGLLNPLIYQKRASAFTDVTSSFPDAANLRVDYTNGEDASGGYTYSVRTFDDDSSLTTTKGYDEVTGVGSPNARWLSALSW